MARTRPSCGLPVFSSLPPGFEKMHSGAGFGNTHFVAVAAVGFFYAHRPAASPAGWHGAAGVLPAVGIVRSANGQRRQYGPRLISGGRVRLFRGRRNRIAAWVGSIAAEVLYALRPARAGAAVALYHLVARQEGRMRREVGDGCRQAIPIVPCRQTSALLKLPDPGLHSSAQERRSAG